MAFYPGSTIRLSCRFRDLYAKTDYDPPGGVTVLIELEPGDTDTTPPTTETYTLGDGDVIKDSVGHYHFDYTPQAAGIYRYRWEGAGSKPVATEAHFKVQETGFQLTE